MLRRWLARVRWWLWRKRHRGAGYDYATRIYQTRDLVDIIDPDEFPLLTRLGRGEVGTHLWN